VFPPANLNEEEDEDVAEDAVDDDETVLQPMPATKKILHAMRQLATFYNPMATNYVQDTGGLV